jgi:iron-sulfur cluster assembly accessory protein
MELIEITDEAIKTLMDKKAKDQFEFIRLGITGGGCAGYEYVFDSADTQLDGDTLIDYGPIKFVVDEESKPFIAGMTLDWIKEGLNEVFKFINPKEESSCGCGVSIQFNMNEVNNYENIISKG